MIAKSQAAIVYKASSATSALKTPAAQRMSWPLPPFIQTIAAGR